MSEVAQPLEERDEQTRLVDRRRVPPLALRRPTSACWLPSLRTPPQPIFVSDRPHASEFLLTTPASTAGGKRPGTFLKGVHQIFFSARAPRRRRSPLEDFGGQTKSSFARTELSPPFRLLENLSCLGDAEEQPHRQSRLRGIRREAGHVRSRQFLSLFDEQGRYKSGGGEVGVVFLTKSGTQYQGSSDSRAGCSFAPRWTVPARGVTRMNRRLTA